MYLFLIFVVVPSRWESSQRHPDTLDTAAEYLMLMKLSVSESGGWSPQEFDKVWSRWLWKTLERHSLSNMFDDYRSRFCRRDLPSEVRQQLLTRSCCTTGKNSCIIIRSHCLSFLPAWTLTPGIRGELRRNCFPVAVSSGHAVIYSRPDVHVFPELDLCTGYLESGVINILNRYNSN